MTRTSRTDRSHPTPRTLRRRQWGAEPPRRPLPTVHPRPTDRKVTLGRVGIVATVVCWLAYIVYTIMREFLNNGGGFRFTTEAVSYLVVMTFLTFSALMYLLARQGALERFRHHQRVPRAELDRHLTVGHGRLTVLVPSYSEEPDVVRSTLWSAALQEYPALRVVLLLDDAPFPTDQDAAEKLRRSRAIAAEIQRALDGPRERFDAALETFQSRRDDGRSWVHREEVAALAGHYHWAADWLGEMADAEAVEDHVGEFFVTEVLRGLADDLRLIAQALDGALAERSAPSAQRMLELHRRLLWTFSADLGNFERKLYVSVSHEANKAMNLNAYLDLMGGSYRAEETPDGTVLRRAVRPEPGDLTVPDAEYVLTLDADSLLLREYCIRLVHFLEQPGNERVGVTQTPYSAFRGARTRIERLAGATTDLQHILHQGMSHFGAAFWVGANAVIRKKALEEIAETETVGGFRVRRFVQDRTVIEDTESSIDLGSHGWSLVNYPERLSYSATPPDFGSLIVQRRRWANGGLLILPKLWREVRERKLRGQRVPLAELLLRMNYMASISWASFGLIFLLAYPYDGRLLSPVVVLAALPYFLAVADDLKYCGYKRSDVFRIYGFNLILLPVNLAGVIKSLEQALTSKKIPFARTPKVRSRTAAPILYVIAPYLIVAFSVFTLWRDAIAGNWGNAAFAALNATLASAAILAYIGIGNSLVDLWLGLTRWLYVERAARPVPAPHPVDGFDWRAILYHGHRDGPAPREDDTLQIVDRDEPAVPGHPAEPRLALSAGRRDREVRP